MLEQNSFRVLLQGFGFPASYTILSRSCQQAQGFPYTNLSDNTSFRLVKSSTAVSLRFFVGPLKVREKPLLIQVIMCHGAGY